MKFFDHLTLSMLLIACATIGLAPFAPPHIWQKLQMLMAGALVRPVDIFDLVMHGAPWLLLAGKLVRMRQTGAGRGG